MNKLTQLDQYDIAMIRHFKSNAALNWDCLRFIWSERNNVKNPQDVKLEYIVQRLALIADSFNPIPLHEFALRLAPFNSWRYGLEENANWDVRCIAVLALHLALTEDTKFPGYK